MKINTNLKTLSPLTLLRLGLGGTLLWGGLNMFFMREYWYKFIPTVFKFLSQDVFISVYSVVLLLVGVALIFAKFKKTTTVFTFLNSFLILAIYGIDETTFQNFGLALSALALFYFYENEKNKEDLKTEKNEG